MGADDDSPPGGTPPGAEPAPADPGEGSGSQATPGGNVYEWYVRGVQLLESGNPSAAAQVLSHAVSEEPASRSVREALARAEFDAGRYAEARASFAEVVAHDPADDYAQFGLGLSASRLGDYRAAVEHLALAVAMRPDNRHYGTALRRARDALAHGRGVAAGAGRHRAPAPDHEPPAPGGDRAEPPDGAGVTDPGAPRDRDEATGS